MRPEVGTTAVHGGADERRREMTRYTSHMVEKGKHREMRNRFFRPLSLIDRKSVV